MSKENKHLEIERRWLLSSLPPPTVLAASNSEWSHIITVYIVTNPQLEVRIRMRQDFMNNFTFPVVMKLGQGLKRQETPKLSADKPLFDYYYELKPQLPRSAEDYWKIRLPNGRKVEIKCLKRPSSLCGLTLAEVEFDSEEEAKQFNEQDFPDWLKPLVVKEVTEDIRYNGKNLAVYGRPNPE